MPLEISGLSLRYGTKWALRDIDLSLSEGQVVGLCGQSGSGKTSLLKAVAGLGPAPSGSITGAPAKAMYYDGCDLPKTGLFRRPPNQSRGETAREKLEEVLRSGSKLRLLDEPFRHGGAPESKTEIRRSAPGGFTMIASNSFEDLADVADEIVVLAKGYVVRRGTPREVYEDPQNVCTAAATGANNLIEARRLTSTNADMPEFQTIEGGHRIFAKAVEKHRLGAINQNVVLSIRPEHIMMSMGASFPEDNLLKAVVTEIMFQGPCTTIWFDAGGLRLSSKVFRVVGLSAGDECMLGLPPDRISILKD